MISERVKYTKDISDDTVYANIRSKAELYFRENEIDRFGNPGLYIRGFILLILSIVSFVIIITTSEFIYLQTAYLLLGFSLLTLGMTLGHDAAHHCLTGNLKRDNRIFEFIFILQGTYPSLWKFKHNSSHHPFPNVEHMDMDLEVTPLLRLSPYQKRKSIHRYQHLYAPFLYLFSSLIWIFIYDIQLLFKRKHCNLSSGRNKYNVRNLLLTKGLYITLYVFIPILFSLSSAVHIVTAFFIMHGLLSLFLTFTFLISHHVTNTKYVNGRNNSNLETSWLKQQVGSTIDFHPESRLCNYIFGGFNAHIAHHLFPGVSHVHYPALTCIIRDELKTNRIPYHATSFFGGVKLHLEHIKNMGKQW